MWRKTCMFLILHILSCIEVWWPSSANSKSISSNAAHDLDFEIQCKIPEFPMQIPNIYTRIYIKFPESRSDATFQLIDFLFPDLKTYQNKYFLKVYEYKKPGKIQCEARNIKILKFQKCKFQNIKIAFTRETTLNL